jgi:O-antigen biosynthesis protein WbqP
MYKFTLRQKIYLPFKRLIDILGSLLGIIVLSPLLLISWIITLCAEGYPAIFKQKRPGKHEKPFTIYKFRSMKKNAPQLPAENVTTEERADMVTGWGRFLRRSSIDELPQLFNILFGQMSFIGPRPGLLADKEPELAIARRSYVPSAYEVKPGLSGYAQIYLRRNHDTNLRAQADSYYVQHLSFWLDAKIFFLSFLVPFGYVPGK